MRAAALVLGLSTTLVGAQYAQQNIPGQPVQQFIETPYLA